MVAMESTAMLSGDGSREREAQRTEPPVSRAGPASPATHTGRGSCGSREGNHSRIFSGIVATGPAANRDSFHVGDRRTSASVPTHVGGPCNGFGSANGVGGERRNRAGTSEPVLAGDKPEVLKRKMGRRTFNMSREGSDADAALGQREHAAAQTRRNRGTLRPLSAACAGGRARNGEIPGAVRAVIARGGVP